MTRLLYAYARRRVSCRSLHIMSIAAKPGRRRQWLKASAGSNKAGDGRARHLYAGNAALNAALQACHHSLHAVCIADDE